MPILTIIPQQIQMRSQSARIRKPPAQEPVCQLQCARILSALMHTNLRQFAKINKSLMQLQRPLRLILLPSDQKLQQNIPKLFQYGANKLIKDLLYRNNSIKRNIEFYVSEREPKQDQVHQDQAIVQQMPNGQVIGTPKGQVIGTPKGQVLSVNKGQVLSVNKGQILSVNKGEVLSVNKGQILSKNNNGIVHVSPNAQSIKHRPISAFQVYSPNPDCSTVDISEVFSSKYRTSNAMNAEQVCKSTFTKHIAQDRRYSLSSRHIPEKKTRILQINAVPTQHQTIQQMEQFIFCSNQIFIDEKGRGREKNNHIQPNHRGEVKSVIFQREAERYPKHDSQKGSIKKKNCQPPKTSAQLGREWYLKVMRKTLEDREKEKINQKIRKGSQENCLLKTPSQGYRRRSKCWQKRIV